MVLDLSTVVVSCFLPQEARLHKASATEITAATRKIGMWQNRLKMEFVFTTKPIARPINTKRQLENFHIQIKGCERKKSTPPVKRKFMTESQPSAGRVSSAEATSLLQYFEHQHCTFLDG